MAATGASPTLKPQLGIFAAVMMGLGSIIGTGIFLSIGLAAGIAGPSLVLAIAIAAIVATFNALSSAQLAAVHPVSGGTYEYGYQFLHPLAGFLAGWLFLLAKSASAATAALGFAGYAVTALGVGDVSRASIAFVTVLIFTAVVLAGIRRSNQVNFIIVVFTAGALLAFCGSVFWLRFRSGLGGALSPFFHGETASEALQNLLHATALMFVAYTGYGRIATLAEEVNDPRRTIPRAIIATLALSAVLYLAVSAAAVGAFGSAFLYDATTDEGAPLQVVARALEVPLVPWLVTAGAAVSMLGVLLNLLLGLSRVLLAMGRRGDMPASLGKLDAGGNTPVASVLVVGALVAALTLIGSVKTTWSFSAFTVLSYYAITNAAAIALPRELLLYPRWIPFAGLSSCLLLAFWVDAHVWLTGLVLVLAGGLWWSVARTAGGGSHRTPGAS